MAHTAGDRQTSRTDSYRVVGMRSLLGAHRVLEEVIVIPGVEDVDIQMDSGVVNIRGVALPEPDEVEAAIADAGFRVSG